MANRKVTQAVKLALISAGAVSAGLYGVIGSAQEQLNEVVVTGSRIARPDLEGVSPITIVSGSAIVEGGFTDVGDLLQTIPSMSGSPIGTTTNNGGNGGVFVDLRGMGSQRTVTLVNGKRTVDGGDYQTIPANIIDRVEILKGGASAAYGADAVSGVVNIITRKEFDGIEISAQRADWDETKAGAQDAISVFGGHSFDNGAHFVFGAEFVDQESAFQADAPWEFFQDSYYVYPAGCESQMFLPYDGTTAGGCYRGGSSRIPEGRLRFATQGTFMNADGSGIVRFDGRLYNFAPVNYIQTPFKRTNLFVDGSFPLTDTIEFTASMRANYRQSEQLLAPNPYDSRSGFDPGYSGTWLNPATSTIVAYNGISQDNYYLRRAVDAYNVLNPTAPLAYQPVTDARRRFVEIPRSFTQDVLQVQTNVGLNGTILDNVKWDFYYNFGYRSRTDHDYGQFSGAELGNAMGPSADLDSNGVPECYRNISDPTTLISGCVPINFFGGPGSVTQDMLGYIGANLTDTIINKQHEASLSFSGNWFDLPGGKLGWALGYGYGKESLEFAPDSMKQKGTVTGNKGVGTSGTLESDSFYGELYAPLFDNGSQALTGNVLARYDDYDAFDAEFTYSLGLDFNVIKDLKLRGSYATVFRAPTIGDLFGGVTDSFPTYNDPCTPLVPGGPIAPGCAQVAPAERQVLAKLGGNPFLQPETGDTFSVGLVWTPQIGPGSFSATVDYWEISLDDAISSLGVQFTLDSCYKDLNAASCALITRRPDYSIAQIIDGSINVATQGVVGFDTELRYGWDTNVGRWEAAILWSHMLERTKTPFPGADEDDLVGRYSDPTAQDGGAYADDKVNYSLKWYWNDLLIGYQGEYISALKADVTFADFLPAGYKQAIDSQLYHDIVASYDFGQGTKVSGGVSNITNEAPPWIDIGFNAKTDPSTYRMFGRGYYLRLTHTFK